MRQLFLLLIFLVSFSSCKKAELVPDFEDYCGTWVNEQFNERLIITKDKIIYQNIYLNDKYIVLKMSEGIYQGQRLLSVVAKIKNHQFNNKTDFTILLNTQENQLNAFYVTFTKQ